MRSDAENADAGAALIRAEVRLTVAGNRSSRCLAGWFVRYIDVGPVDQSMIGIGNSDAIGVQLIR